MRSVRVAIVIPRYFPIFGGAENQCRLLCQTLVESQQVSIPFLITKRIRSDLPKSEIIDGIHVKRLGLPGFDRWTTYGFYISLAIYLLRNAKLYDIVHCHATSTLGFTVALCGRMLRKRVILKLSSNGEFVKGFGNPAWRRSPLQGILLSLRRKLVQFTALNSHTVALNQEGKSELRAAGAKSISVIPNGVDPRIYFMPQPDDKSMLRQKYGYSDEDSVILFTGRFVENKGIDLLLAAFADFLDHCGDSTCCRWKLALAGTEELQPDPMRAEIERAMERYPGMIRMLPPKIPVTEYLHMSDIFVFPSRREGMPNSVLEALAVGLPCVLSDIAPHLELATANEAAHLHFFTSGDASSLRIALKEALRDAAYMRSSDSMSCSPLDRRFVIHNITQTYLSLYRSVSGTV